MSEARDKQYIYLELTTFQLCIGYGRFYRTSKAGDYIYKYIGEL